MAKSPHVCKYFARDGVYSRRGWRGNRRCEWCGKHEITVKRDGQVVWEEVKDLRWFGDKWLPPISGTDPRRLMLVEVAYPFEWNTYENWNVVFRVTFQLPSDYMDQRPTRIDIMNGWKSSWHEYFNRIDAEAEAYYTERTNRGYEIGDQAPADMRAIIQAPVAKPKPPDLRSVK